MEQAAREVAHDTVAATQAVMTQYQAELDAARREDEEVNQKVRSVLGLSRPVLSSQAVLAARLFCDINVLWRFSAALLLCLWMD